MKTINPVKIRNAIPPMTLPTITPVLDDTLEISGIPSLVGSCVIIDFDCCSTIVVEMVGLDGSEIGVGVGVVLGMVQLNVNDNKIIVPFLLNVPHDP